MLLRKMYFGCPRVTLDMVIWHECGEGPAVPSGSLLCRQSVRPAGRAGTESTARHRVRAASCTGSRSVRQAGRGQSTDRHRVRAARPDKKRPSCTGCRRPGGGRPAGGAPGLGVGPVKTAATAGRMQVKAAVRGQCAGRPGPPARWATGR